VSKGTRTDLAVDVGLARVYDLSMGRRLADLPFWERRIVNDGPVIEVGAHPRISRQFGRDWVCIDIDPEMCDLCLGEVAAVCGNALDESVWEEVAALLSKRAAYAIIPFSTIYLVEHARQAELIKLAGKYADEVVVEAFIPKPWALKDGHRRTSSGCNSPPGEPEGTWVRSDRYDVSVQAQITTVERFFGEAGKSYRYRVTEELNWRHAEEWRDFILEEVQPAAVQFMLPPASPPDTIGIQLML